jgi:hypothetical protein
MVQPVRRGRRKYCGIWSIKRLRTSARGGSQALQLTNAPKLIRSRNQVESLQIREVRHKLGAHSTDYLNNTTRRIESYIPVRATLSGFICEYFNNETGSSKRADLRNCLNEHFEVLVDLMDKVYEKTVNTLYRGEQEKREEFLEKLKDLRS